MYSNATNEKMILKFIQYCIQTNYYELQNLNLQCKKRT